MMSLGDSAAKLNLPVFPCAANKRPVTENGFKNATTNPAHIVAAFERPGAALIGVPTGAASGFIVIDVDIKNGREGAAWLDENREALPQTRTHKTQSGGLHLLFRCPEGVEIRNSQSRVAPGVDVRGEGGYIIAPPSPGYTLADDTDPADMPHWLIRACLPPPMPPRPVLSDTSPEIASERVEGFIRSVIDRVRTAPEGSKHETLRNAALSLGGIQAASGLSDASAISMLIGALPSTVEDWKLAAATAAWGLEHGRERPIQFEDRPLYRPSSEEQPAWLNGSVPDDVYSDLEAQEAKAPSPTETIPITYFKDIVASSTARDFVENLLIESAMSVIYGESNSGKTFFATDLALHIAAGWAWNERDIDRGAVVYCALEGAHGITQRVAAFKEDHGLDDADLPFGVITTGLNLLDPNAHTGILIDTIVQAGKHLGVPVKLVVLDTLSRAMAGGNENAPDDMGALVMNGDLVREKTGAHVQWIHHSGKDQAKGARGHSLLRAATDTEIEIVADGPRRAARVTKQRELECAGEFSFTLKVVELGTNHRGKPVTSCVVEYGEGQIAGAVSASRRLTGHNKRALEVLTDLVATAGQGGHAGSPAGVSSVPEKWWRDRFYERAMPGDSDEAKQKAFRRASVALVNDHLVGMANRRVWLVPPAFRQPEVDGNV